MRSLSGSIYWRLAPVLACDVAMGSLEKVTSADITGFTSRLIAAIPSLETHKCTRGHPGGFVERLTEGTHLPHILEHIALELQTLIGNDVSFGRVVPSGDEGVWWLIVAYEEEQVGLQAMHDAVTIVRACISGDKIDVRAITDELLALHDSSRLGPSTGAMVEEFRGDSRTRQDCVKHGSILPHTGLASSSSNSPRDATIACSSSTRKLSRLPSVFRRT